MRRWVLILGAILSVLYLGEMGTELGQLKPVQLLYIEEADNQIVIRTDLGDLGTGKNLQDAVRDLRKTSQGKIFLETAEQLVLTEDTADEISECWEILRPAVRVCLSEGIIEPEKAAAYLQVHQPEVMLKDLKQGNMELPTLISREGRYVLGQGR